MAEPFDSIFQCVVEDTNRPDLVAEIQNGIARAVVYFHNLEFWDEDKVHVSPNFTEFEGKLIIDKAAELPRYKRLCEGRDSCGNVATAFTVNGECCIAKNTSNILCSNAKVGFFEDSKQFTVTLPQVAGGFNTIEMCYYQCPKTSPIQNLESWIADKYPEYICGYATKHVLRLIGNLTQSTTETQEVIEFTENLLRMHLPDQR